METLLIKSSPEAAEARRRFISKLRAEAIGRPVVKSLIAPPRKKKLGEQINATDELRTHRKEIQQNRNAGLEEALSRRRAYAEKTKAELKFAKNGYSRTDKKVALRVEATRLEQKLTSEREASGRIRPVQERRGLVGRLGNVLERRSNKRELKQVRGDAKEFAKLSIRQKEEAEHKKIDDYQLAHQEAKARRFQTAHALVRSKLHLTGRRSNALSTFRDVRKSGKNHSQSIDDRLESLSDRRAMNESKLDNPRYHSISTSQKPYISVANARMSPEAHQRRIEHNEAYNLEQLEKIGPVHGPSEPTKEEIETGPWQGPLLPVEPVIVETAPTTVASAPTVV